MPELPEVETVRRQIGPKVIGQQVADAGSHPSQKFSDARLTTGLTFTDVQRRGKYLILETDDGQDLVVHLGMTGKVLFRDDGPDLDNPHLRAWWRLDDVTMEFIDVRRFGRLRLVPAGDYSTIPTLHHAGPEPWDPELTPRKFWELLGQSRRAIKTNLLSQRPIAGVGNIYADEALWIAEINPRSTRVGRDRAEHLLDALRHVLQQGIDNGGTTLRDYRNAEGGAGENQHELLAYGRGGEECLRCGRELRSGTIDARTTVWCPVCQKR